MLVCALLALDCWPFSALLFFACLVFSTGMYFSDRRLAVDCVAVLCDALTDSITFAVIPSVAAVAVGFDLAEFRLAPGIRST